MRNFGNFNAYLDELAGDVYEQPRDAGHDRKTQNLLMEWLPNIHGVGDDKTVIDLGCGQGNAFDIFDAFGWTWHGITTGRDYEACKARGLPVSNADFSFLPTIPDSSFDMIFARHALEHSPVPLLTLMEWHRIGRRYMIVVLPSVEVEIVAGLNHYVLLKKIQWEALFYRAGWKVIWEDTRDKAEYRLLCEKTVRKPAPYDYTEFTARVEDGNDMRENNG